MINELRYYLEQIKIAMANSTEEELEAGELARTPFVPKYFITAVKLPTGAVELAINTENIAGKIDYVLEAYDEEMRLKTNTSISMQNMMVV